MTEQALLINVALLEPTSNGIGMLRLKYQAYQSLFQAQPTQVQQYLRTQAAVLAEAILQKLHHFQFRLPDRVAVHHQDSDSIEPIPEEQRVQHLGGLMGNLIRADMSTMLRLRMLELEHSPSQAVSTAGMLIRHALAVHMVHNMLPSGKTVQYTALDGDEIPNIPVFGDSEIKLPFGKANVSDSPYDAQREIGGDNSAIPFVKAATRFYMPQWVAFDDECNLLAGSVAEAAADIVSMQHYLSVLHTAVDLAPYLVADDDYQSKRYGMLGQLVNQGRALAIYELGEIVRTIERRAAAHSLDRGLSVSLPYFDDQSLSLENCRFEVIPVGRVMFVPAFVVLAVRAQGRKIAQDTSLSHSTRRHILTELGVLEKVFLR